MNNVRNINEYLDSFNAIEKKLRNDINDTRNMRFNDLINKNKMKNKIVLKHERELKEHGKLRNFMAHDEILDPMAIPSDVAINRIKFLENEILNPVKIEDIFDGGIETVQENDSLSKVLNMIKKKRHSQFPVLRDKKFIGLVTENGIINWLADHLDNDIINIKDAKVKDLMLNDINIYSYEVVTLEDDIYKVIDMFEKSRKVEDKTFTIIVLYREKKKRNIFIDDIYTILTRWDLDTIYKRVGIDRE